MKHKVSRLACGLLAAVLILGMTACAGKPESGASGKFKGGHAANPTAAQEKTARQPKPLPPPCPHGPGNKNRLPGRIKRNTMTV